MNKMLLVPFLSLLLTPPALAGGAQADRPDMSGPKPSSLELTTTVLDFPTGLRVLIQEDHAHPVVKTYMYVGHGFNDDPAGAAWFVKLKPADASEIDGLLDEAAYKEQADG